MAQTVDPPGENPGEGEPGTPGYIPPTGANSKLSVVVASANVTFTAAQIVAAGGPWPSFKVRVTPINDVGAGTPQQITKTL